MENFKALRNEIIKHVDSIAKPPQARGNMKNSLKTIVTDDLINQESGGIFGRKDTYQLSQKHDNCSQVRAKVTVETKEFDENIGVENFLATRLFKDVILRTGSGVVLQHVRPEYIYQRVKELQEASSTYKRLHDSTEASDEFKDADVDPTVRKDTLVVPFFFFFEESTNAFLTTRSNEKLFIDLHVADSLQQMGIDESASVLPLELAKFNVTMYTTYHDVDNPMGSENYNLIPHPNKPGPKRFLPSSFNCFYEDRVEIPAGTTKAKLLLRCTEPLYALTSIVRTDDTQSIVGIANMSISVRGNYILEKFPNVLNYNLYSEDRGCGDSEPFTYFFSQMESREYDSGLITFGSDDAMYPVFLEIELENASTSNSTLYTFCEYRTYHEVRKDGVILDSTWAGKIQAQNSNGYT